MVNLHQTHGNRPMSPRDSLLASLKAALLQLKQKYPIRSLGLFGSFARGDAGERSDIDIPGGVRPPGVLVQVPCARGRVEGADRA
jgi:Nucleotidyltransferase domain